MQHQSSFLAHARRFSALAATALLAASALSMPALAQNGTPPGADVDSLLRLARERNPDYAAVRQEASAASERIEAAGALPDPRLRVELQDLTMSGTQNPTLSPSRVGSTKYTVMQDLPWFGKRDLQREIAVREADGAQGRARAGWAELAARIKNGYAQFYYIDQNLRLSTEILDLLTRLEQVAQARYAGGLAAQTDVIRAQMERSNMQNELIALENDKRTAQSRLNVLLARPANAELAAPQRLRALPPPARLDHDALQERLRNGNPLVFADEARVGAAEKSRDLTYKNRYPDLTLGIVPVQVGSGVRQWEVMLELNIPLQQGSRRSKEREAEALLAAARSRKEATTNQLQSELSETLSALDAARRTAQLSADRLLPQAELTFRSALASYENGKVDFATVLEAQRQIRQARQTNIKAQAEGQARLADLERLLGEDL